MRETISKRMRVVVLKGIKEENEHTERKWEWRDRERGERTMTEQKHSTDKEEHQE